MTPVSRRQLRRSLPGLAFIAPWLVGFVVFTVIPVGMSLYYSFCDYSLLQPPIFKGFDNYLELAREDAFWISLRNTLVYALAALPLGMIAAIGVAVLLNSNITGVSVYRTIVFLPSLVPTVASAMLWLWLFNADLGLINAFLTAIGLRHTPGWLTSPTWAMPALVLMSFWGIGHSVVIYLAGLQDVPRELYEASEIDGATALRKIWHVTLPCLSPVIFFNLIMGIIGTLQIFATPFIMTGGGPGRSTYFYTMHLYNNAFSYLKMGTASAMAWVLLILVLLLSALAAWSGKHWVHYQGR